MDLGLGGRNIQQRMSQKFDGSSFRCVDAMDFLFSVHQEVSSERQFVNGFLAVSSFAAIRGSCSWSGSRSGVYIMDQPSFVSTCPLVPLFKFAFRATTHH